MMHEVVVQSTGEVTTISDETFALMNTPVPILPFIEDVYRIEGKAGAEPKRWFVLFIRPTHGCADRVERFVRRAGFQSYWPKQVNLVTRGRGSKRKRVASTSPLIPRYVLVRLPAEGPPFGLFTGHEGQFSGVCDFIRTANGPLPVRDRQVDQIVLRERAGEFDKTFRHNGKLAAKQDDWVQAGSLVRVIDGPFASFDAVIEEVDAVKYRLKVAVAIFGRSSSVDLELDQVEPVL